MQNIAFTIAGQTIKPGTRRTVSLPAPCLFTQTPMDIPIHVFHGRKMGPKVFVTAAIHGDEINGVEIIRRLQHYSVLRHIRGTLIIVPIVNIYGFVNNSRYLPDRRDLNRSFPGTAKGSLASRLAFLIMNEIVAQCEYGIDLHTGSLSRTNLPQIRVDLDTKGAIELAEAFNTPVILDAKLRDGSLRQAAAERGIPLLVYEAGEALRFDEVSIRVGIRGILDCLLKLDMIAPSAMRLHKAIKPKLARSSYWLRASVSGIVRENVDLGNFITEGEIIGFINDPFGSQSTKLIAPADGIIIGKNNLPLVNEGDALYHVAEFKNAELVAKQVEIMQQQEEK